MMIMIIGTGAEMVKVNFISGLLSPAKKKLLKNCHCNIKPENSSGAP